MKGVFGKPFVCLDNYIDTKGLLDIVEDINYGIAKSHQYIKPNFAPTYQTVDVTDKNKVKDFGSAYKCWLNDQDPIRKARGQELLNSDIIAFEYWLEYEYNVVEVMSYIVLRDYEKPYAETYVPLDRLKENNFSFSWNHVSNYFLNFKNWCQKLPFKQLGPVVIMLKTAGGPFPLHKDLFFESSDYDHQEQFIWLDPRQTRSLYVLDESNNTKHVMDTGISYYWNNHDLHGGINPIDRMSWTIRIEGIFEDWLVEKLSS